MRKQIQHLMTANAQYWETPADLFLALHQEFGFTVDAAADHQNALLERYWHEKDSALTQDWTGERVFCNPPYDNQRPFIEKAVARQADVAVFLIPARTDTRMWHDLIFGEADDIRFLKGRLKFSNSKHSAPFPSAVIVYASDETAMGEGERPLQHRGLGYNPFE